MIVIRQIAHQEGQSQRTMRLAGNSPVPPPRGPKVPPKTTAVIGTAPGIGVSPSTDTWVTANVVPISPSSPPQADISILQADDVVNAIMVLDNVYGSDAKLEELTRAMRADNRDVMRETVNVPVLTENQIHEAQSAIPTDYWQLNCWSCREGGHSTFTCPMLTPSQRIFFAYKYYLHQIEANPMLKSWFRQKSEAMRQTGPDPGPRPGNNRYNDDNRGRGRFPTRPPRPDSPRPPSREHVQATVQVMRNEQPTPPSATMSEN